MQTEEFETIRDFNRKFPSKLYICPSCRKMTPNPYKCINCGMQATNLLFANETYTYKILETNTVQQIFKPIELEKGELNG